MGTTDKEVTKPVTIMQSMANLLHNVAQLPTDSTSADIAGALTQMGDVEKLLRKKRIALMATLVRKAEQNDLL